MVLNRAFFLVFVVVKPRRSGGASASFGSTPPQVPAMVMAPVSSESSSTPSWAAGLDDDSVKLLPLLAVAAIVIGLFAAGSVVWADPHLLSEILVDGAIAGQAYRRLRTGSWSGGVMHARGNPCSRSSSPLCCWASLGTVSIPLRIRLGIC